MKSQARMAHGCVRPREEPALASCHRASRHDGSGYKCVLRQRRYTWHTFAPWKLHENWATS